MDTWVWLGETVAVALVHGPRIYGEVIDAGSDYLVIREQTTFIRWTDQTVPMNIIMKIERV
jgi:hypothetical protein